MQKRPTPPGGFTNSGNDFTYLRTVEGHRMGGGGVPREPMLVDEYQNAATFDDCFNNNGDEF